MVQKILLVEDDPTLVHALETTLGLTYSISAVATQSDALRLLETQAFGALVVDAVLQNGTGLGVIKHAKQNQPDLPVVVITAQATKSLAIDCLNLGVRKFVEKPFQLGELISALKESLPEEEVRLLDGWILRRNRRRIEFDGNEAPLTPIEYRIVEYLVGNANRCVPRDELIKLLWGDTKISNHALDTHLSSLRKKAKPLGDKIKVSRGRGYWWEA
jgi:DNA-binding response OmpR family regulator